MKITRREFLEKVVSGAGGLTLADQLLAGGALAEAREGGSSLPTRLFGRTRVRVPIIGLGSATLQDFPQKEVEKVVNGAIDRGITYIDTAPNYGNVEEKLGPIVKRRREEIFLVTKVEEQDKEGALRQVQESLKRLQTDHLDLVHLHSLGDEDVDLVLGKEGALAGLLEAKAKGWLRFIGVSGHNRPGKFLPALRTGQIDALMVAMNYVDRFTYNFEERVLPEARKRNLGIAAMKVLGGPMGFQYHPPAPGRLSGEAYSDALRYALSLPGVAIAVVGMRDIGQVEQAVKVARSFRPLTLTEMERLLAQGQRLAKEWGPHFGPVS